MFRLAMLCNKVKQVYLDSFRYKVMWNHRMFRTLRWAELRMVMFAYINPCIVSWVLDIGAKEALHVMLFGGQNARAYRPLALSICYTVMGIFRLLACYYLISSACQSLKAQEPVPLAEPTISLVLVNANEVPPKLWTTIVLIRIQDETLKVCALARKSDYGFRTELAFCPQVLTVPPGWLRSSPAAHRMRAMWLRMRRCCVYA